MGSEDVYKRQLFGLTADLRLVAFLPLSAESRRLSPFQHLVAKRAVVRRLLAIVTGGAHRHRWDIDGRRVRAVHHPLVAVRAGDVAVPVLLMADLEPVIDLSLIHI